MLILLGNANSVYPLGLPYNIYLFNMNPANGLLICTGSQMTPLWVRLLIFGARLISLGEYYACILVTRVAIFNEYEKKEERYRSNACCKCRFAKVL
jgi:hypothetical protein